MSRRRRGKNQTARAGQAEKGVEGKGIPAPPSLSAAAEFRASEAGAPRSPVI